MGVTFCPYPIPVIVNELGEGYILYVKSNYIFNNDEFCIVLKDGGRILHVTSEQVRVLRNETYKIIKNESG